MVVWGSLLPPSPVWGRGLSWVLEGEKVSWGASGREAPLLGKQAPKPEFLMPLRAGGWSTENVSAGASAWVPPEPFHTTLVVLQKHKWEYVTPVHAAVEGFPISFRIQNQVLQKPMSPSEASHVQRVWGVSKATWVCESGRDEKQWREPHLWKGDKEWGRLWPPVMHCELPLNPSGPTWKKAAILVCLRESGNPDFCMKSPFKNIWLKKKSEKKQCADKIHLQDSCPDQNRGPLAWGPALLHLALPGSAATVRTTLCPVHHFLFTVAPLLSASPVVWAPPRPGPLCVWCSVPTVGVEPSAQLSVIRVYFLVPT